MEAVIIGLIATAFAQISKKTGLSGRQLGFLASLVLAVAYFVVQFFVDETTLKELGVNFLTIWGTATVFYDYVYKVIRVKGNK